MEDGASGKEHIFGSIVWVKSDESARLRKSALVMLVHTRRSSKPYRDMNRSET
jgi:hypothetical protein